jgi:hypothetical protein
MYSCRAGELCVLESRWICQSGQLGPKNVPKSKRERGSELQSHSKWNMYAVVEEEEKEERKEDEGKVRNPPPLTIINHIMNDKHHSVATLPP